MENEERVPMDEEQSPITEAPAAGEAPPETTEEPIVILEPELEEEPVVVVEPELTAATAEEVPEIRAEAPPAPPAPPKAPVTGPAPASAAPPAKSSKMKWIIPCVAAAALIIGAALGIPAMKEQNNIKRYNQGADMIERGDYQGAYETFKELGNYEDSFTLAMYAQRGMGYTAAKELMERGDYDKAAETFDGLAGFKDSRELAAECRNEQAYQKAVALFDAEDYAAAEEAFRELGDYSGAKDYAARCAHEQADIAYNEAIQAGDYAKALEVLDSGEGRWDNEAAMRTECTNHLTYIEATQDLAAGRNYSALKKFQSLGTFLDSAERAKTCKVSKPANGEIYRNSKYSGKACTIAFKLPDNGGFYYFKIYSVNSSGKETLASTMFGRAKKTVSVKLPAGSYVIKYAFGTGAWYGETEMFGEDAVYEKLIGGDDFDSFKLKKNQKLTITFGVTNGNTGSSGESMGTL